MSFLEVIFTLFALPAIAVTWVYALAAITEAWRYIRG